jgi:hypothetical protein
MPYIFENFAERTQKLYMIFSHIVVKLVSNSYQQTVFEILVDVVNI